MKKVYKNVGEDKIYLGRSCEGCIFKDDHWDGKYCDTGRREKLHERGEVVDKNIISRFCNLYRDEAWRNKHLERFAKTGVIHPEDVSQEYYYDRASKEVEPSFSIVLDAIGVEREAFDQLIKCVSNMSYNTGRYNIVISGSMGDNVEPLVTHVNELKQQGLEAVLVLHNPDNDHVPSRDQDTFSKCVGYDFIVTVDSVLCDINHDLFNHIDRIINDEMEKVLYFTNPDRNLHIVSFNVMNSLYLKYLNYNAMIGSMLEELKESGMYKIL